MKRTLQRVSKVAVAVGAVVFGVAQLVKRLVPEHGDPWSDHFQIVCLMQGRHWKSEAPHLTSGTVVAVAGGVELDLTQTTLDPGGAHLRLTSLMGGIDIRVPADWHVRLEGRAFMGANDLVDLTDRPGDPQLSIDCLTVMGGLQVRGIATDAASGD